MLFRSLRKYYPSSTAANNPSASTQRTGKATGRPHKEKGYEIRTLSTIIKQGIAVPTLAQAPDPNQPMPAGWTVSVVTKARSVHHCGVANVGNVLVEFEQWHNPKHPDLDGPLSGPATCIIT